MSTDRPTILIASDHNGNYARDYLVEVLLQWAYDVVDMGPRTDENVGHVDYTKYATQLAYAISKNKRLQGILICGTGVGMSIAANRIPGVQASLVHDPDTAKKTREHNHSNVLCMAAWTTSPSDMVDIMYNWLEEDFGHDRHEPRVAELGKRSSDDVVLVPGVFEILQPGHIELFKFARKFGRVVVALNTDESARKIKTVRPFVNENDRYDVLINLNLVDEVLMMDDTDAGNLLKMTKAKFIVKGGPHEDSDVVRVRDNVPDDCEVKMMPIDEHYSTEKIRKKIRGEQ